MSKLKKGFQNAVEQLGLDWFLILINISVLEDTSIPLYPSTYPEISEKFSGIDDDTKLEHALDYCKALLKREEERIDKIESKAFTLISITGVAAGLITGLASLLLDNQKIASAPILILAALMYFLVVISLMWTIFLAMKVVTIGEYRMSYPSADDVFRLSNASLQYVKQEYAISTFYSFARNAKVANRKGTYLGGAQLWFRNSIVLLLMLTMILSSYSAFKPSIFVNDIVTPLYQQTALPQSTLQPTDIPQPSLMPPLTLTNTSTSTKAPTVVIQNKTPTFTLTPMDAETPASSP